MKKAFKIIAALLLLLLIVAIAVPFLVPLSAYKAELASRVREATGRDLLIAGEMRATVFPNLGIRAEKVALSNPRGFADASMAEIEALTLEVAFLPLLSGDVQVKRFILQKPVIRLEVNAAGKPNWDFSPRQVAALFEANPSAAGGLSFVSNAYAAPAANPAAAPAKASISALKNLSLEAMSIENGTVSYFDQRSRQRQTVTGLNLDAALPGMNSALTLAGEALVNERNVAFSLKADAPLKLSQGGESPVSLEVKAKSLMQLEFKGNASLTGAKGAFEFDSPSLPKLSAWLGSDMGWRGNTALSFAVKGNLSCDMSRCALGGGDLALDALRAKGDMAASFGGSVPSIQAKLAAGALDLTPYLMTADAGGNERVFAFIPAAHAQSGGTGWSQERIDLSGLRALNAYIAITAESLRLPQLTVDKLVADANIRSGVLALDVPQAGIFGGAVKLNMRADGNGDVPAIDSRGSFSGIRAEKALPALTGNDRLSGAAQGEFNLSGRGASQAQIISALSGNGSLRFTDGAIKGIDIPGMVRNIKSAFSGEAGGSQKTDFSELGGTFAISQGILRNNDLAMKAPLMRLKGAGTVDLPRRYVNYRLEPELVNTLKGQGGKDKEGLGVPVIVEGPFERLTYRPDLESALREAIQNPEKLKEQVNTVKEQLKEGKTDLKDLKKSLKENPDAVGNLLKGLGR